MAAHTEAQIIEWFHLAFLEVLRRRIDPGRYVLKGGANLRYFFNSPRYSEDIDLDMAHIEPWAFAEKVDDVLASPPLAFLLRSGGLEVATADITKPKQTETTRRWKVPVSAPGHSKPLRTGIEFSSRNGEERYDLDTVPDRIVEPYGIRAPAVQRYRAEPAAEQKVRALARRSQTQARDVFDLELLFRATGAAPLAVESEIRKEAADRALELPVEAFQDQVLPFLDPDVAELYDDDAWNRMQVFVTDRLLAD